MSFTEPIQQDAAPPESPFRIAQWADVVRSLEREALHVDTGERPTTLPLSSASGEALLSNGSLGADIIRLPAGTAFTPHTHEGDHLLIVIAGKGTIACEGKVHATSAGDIYLVPGHAPHAVGAITDHVLIAVGAPHTPIDAPNRMAPVKYRAMTSAFLDLHCLICDLRAASPVRLHELGCSHCPCETCHPPVGTMR